MVSVAEGGLFGFGWFCQVTFVTAQSPHLVDGRPNPAAERGRALFYSERVACHRCHPPPLYTDLKMHNVNTRSPNEHNARFDTPTLVEVWHTAPYLHDGRYRTLRDLFAEGRHGLRPGPEPLGCSSSSG